MEMSACFPPKPDFYLGFNHPGGCRFRFLGDLVLTILST